MTNLQTNRNARDISLRREDAAAEATNRSGDASGSRALADMALQAALDRKALEPVMLNVSELCSYTDYILLVSARSDRQVGAVVDAVSSTLKKAGHMPLGSEGANSGQWALLDFGDVIVHVFHHPTREFYDLESLWVDAKRVELDIPDDARMRADDMY